MKGVLTRVGWMCDRPCDWAEATFPDLAFTPEQVVSAAADWPEWGGHIDEHGIYFLQRRGKICYVGQAKGIIRRLRQHQMQVRPFDKVTVIAGIHWECLNDLEFAYISAWEPPWNWATPPWYFKCTLALRDRLAAMNQDLVCNQPETAPLTVEQVSALADRLG